MTKQEPRLTADELDAIRAECEEARVAAEAIDNDEGCEDSHNKVINYFQDNAQEFIPKLLDLIAEKDAKIERLQKAVLGYCSWEDAHG